MDIAAPGVGILRPTRAATTRPWTAPPWLPLRRGAAPTASSTWSQPAAVIDAIVATGENGYTGQGGDHPEPCPISPHSSTCRPCPRTAHAHLPPRPVCLPDRGLPDKDPDPADTGSVGAQDGEDGSGGTNPADGTDGTDGTGPVDADGDGYDETETRRRRPERLPGSRRRLQRDRNCDGDPTAGPTAASASPTRTATATATRSNPSTAEPGGGRRRRNGSRRRRRPHQPGRRGPRR